MKGMLRGAVREDMQARLRMGLIHRNYPGRKSWKGNLWKNVSAFDVGEFLRKYTYPAGIHRFDPKLISQYIGRMVKDHEELTNWIVVLLGRNGGENIMRWAVGDGISINCNQRTGSERDAECVIRSVLSPEDEYIDLSREEWNDALELSLDFFRNGMLDQCRPPKYPVGKATRQIRGRHPQDSLLLLYPLHIRNKEGKSFTVNCPFTGFAISFPASKNSAYGKFCPAGAYLKAQH